MKACFAPVIALLLFPVVTIGGPPSQLFEIKSVSLDPATFTLTLVIPGIRGGTIGLLSHDGPPSTNEVTWTMVGTQTAEETGLLTFVDNVSGSLSYSGKTYRCVYNDYIFSVNQVFIGYPFLTNPVVRIPEQLSTSNSVAIEYANGIYSNRIAVVLSNDVLAAFFRMWAPDNDPKHALIQTCTNGLSGSWTNCAAK